MPLFVSWTCVLTHTYELFLSPKQNLKTNTTGAQLYLKKEVPQLVLKVHLVLLCKGPNGLVPLIDTYSIDPLIEFPLVI